MLFKGGSVFLRMTVLENLLMGGWIIGRGQQIKEPLGRIYNRYLALEQKKRARAGDLNKR